MKKKDPTLQMIRDLEDGLNSPFWLALKKIIQDEKESLEAQIFEDEELDGDKRDNLRRWRNYLAYFLDLPERMIENMAAPRNQEEPDFEVYDTPKDPLKELSSKILA